MNSISQLPAEEIHRLMTTPGAMRLEDIPLVHLRAAELLKQMAELEKDAKRYRAKKEIDRRKIEQSPVFTGATKREQELMRRGWTISYDASMDAALAAMQDRS